MTMTSMWQSRCCWKMLLVVPTRYERVLRRSICCSGRYGWKNDPCERDDHEGTVRQSGIEPLYPRISSSARRSKRETLERGRRTLPKMLSGSPRYRIRLYLSLVLRLVGLVRRRERWSRTGEAASSSAVRRAAEGEGPCASQLSSARKEGVRARRTWD